MEPKQMTEEVRQFWRTTWAVWRTGRLGDILPTPAATVWSAGRLTDILTMRRTKISPSFNRFLESWADSDLEAIENLLTIGVPRPKEFLILWSGLDAAGGSNAKPWYLLTSNRIFIWDKEKDRYASFELSEIESYECKVGWSAVTCNVKTKDGMRVFNAGCPSLIGTFAVDQVHKGAWSEILTDLPELDADETRQRRKELLANVDFLMKLDLSQESVSSLEVERNRLTSHWRQHAYDTIAKGFKIALPILAVFAVLGLLVGSAGDKELGWLVAIGGLLGSAFVAGLYLLSAIGKLIRSVPKSPVSAEECLRRHYGALVDAIRVACGGYGVADWIDAYICCLQQARSKYENIDHYVDTKKKDVESIVEEIRDYFSPHPFSQADAEIESFTKLQQDGPVEVYEIRIKIEGFKGMYGSSFNPLTSLGICHLIERKAVARLDGGYFLADATWTGILG